MSILINLGLLGFFSIPGLRPYSTVDAVVTAAVCAKERFLRRMTSQPFQNETCKMTYSKYGVHVHLVVVSGGPANEPWRGLHCIGPSWPVKVLKLVGSPYSGKSSRSSAAPRVFRGSTYSASEVSDF